MKKIIHSLKKDNYKIAFTLVEVLITLGIIGIVAAMTIPNIINFFQEQVLLTQFKKVYTELSQAYIMASREYGTADNWTSQQEIYTNLKQYLNVAQDCSNNVGCFPNMYYNGLKGSPTTVNLYLNNSNWYKLRLTNGTSITTSTNLSSLIIDINGDKNPNQFGYDVFYLSLSTKNESPWIGWNSSSILNCSKSQTGAGTDGSACSYWIIRHWNMDYLDRDITSSEWNS